MEGLIGLLKEHDFNVVGAVANGQQLIEAARQLRPDVIVTDLSMPVLGGLDVLSKLKEHRIDSKVVVLTMHDDAERATQALKCGASGFLLKEAAGEELITAIRQALEGRVYLTSAVTKAVFERMADPGGRSAPDLTPRQLDVLRLIVKGQRMKEIATTLNLSTRTVETHKYEMMQALGVGSTAELVKYAIKHGLTPE